MRFLFFLFLVKSSLPVSAFVNHAPRDVLRTSSATCLHDALEPLAEEGTWQAFLDEESTGLIYYFDSKSGDSLWEPPYDTFPRIRLPRKKQRLADDLRRKYRKARQQEGPPEVIVEEQQKEEPNWIAGLFEDEKVVPTEAEIEVEVATATTEAPRQKDWFNNIFADKKSTDEQEDVEEVPALPNGENLVWKKPRGILESFAGLKPELLVAAETAVETVEKEQEEEQIIQIEITPLKIEVGSFVSPHPAKVRWGGEDAVFTKGRTFGVFDGVSGAEKLDGVPLYSRTLAEEMKKTVGADGMSIADMTRSMTAAADYADRCATGASTAVVASIGENGFLQALNVGDSCCVVIRNGRITAKTREISHYWECPYQLSEDSPDRPKDGTKLNVELIPGDLVVMGSDGIFDNVDDDSLLDLIEKSKTKPSQLAKKICDLSRKQSLDRTSVTPYAKQAQKRGDPDYKEGLGGKVDDSSCIVVLCK